MERVDQIEESCGILFFHREEHYVIDGYQVGFEQTVVCAHGRRHQRFHLDGVYDILHRDHIRLVSLPHSFVHESCGDKGLTCSGRSHEYQVVILFEPPQPAQFTQSWCGYTLRVVVVEKVEVVSCRQGRRFQPPLEVLAVSFLNLAGEQVMQELYMFFSLLLRQMSF